MKVCWNITSKCNRNCRYCFKFTKNDLSLEDNKKILARLVELGVKKISWTGGEPFLYEHIKEMLKLSKECGILNHVNTNATILNENNLKENLEFVDRLVISLDFINDELNKEYGIGEDYYAHVKKLLKKIKQIKPDIKIQINTVLFSTNISYIDDLYRELCLYDIDYWKLLRFLPIRGKSLEEEDNLSIADKQFEETVYKYQNTKQSFEIIIHGTEEMTNRHMIVLSSGKLICSEHGKDIEVEDKLI